MMREWIFAKVREWFILGIGLIIVGGGLFAANLSQQRSNSVDVASVKQRKQPAPSASSAEPDSIASQMS
jgi:hypothetical protein